MERLDEQEASVLSLNLPGEGCSHFTTQRRRAGDRMGQKKDER